MPESVRTRLGRLELAAGIGAVVGPSCPACGADWPGFAFAEVADDRRVTCRCWRCGAAVPAESAGRPSKLIRAGLVELL